MKKNHSMHNSNGNSGGNNSVSVGSNSISGNNNGNYSRNNNTSGLSHNQRHTRSGSRHMHTQRKYQNQQSSTSTPIGSPENELMLDNIMIQQLQSPTRHRDRIDITHLVNFSFPPRQPSTGSSAPVRRKARAANWEPFNKERFVNANFRFIMRPGTDCSVYVVDPDVPVEWSDILQVLVPNTTNLLSCPICLQPPLAGKITKCGHVYCHHCILHYLALGDRKWRKCPICYESVYAKDLKSVSEVVMKNIEVKGERDQWGIEKDGKCRMTLMQRAQNSCVALPKSSFQEWISLSKSTTPQMDFPSSPPVLSHPAALAFSKLVLGDKTYWRDTLERELTQLLEKLKEAEEEESLMKAIQLSKSTTTFTPQVPGSSRGLVITEATDVLTDRPFVEMAIREVKEALEQLGSETDLTSSRSEKGKMKREVSESSLKSPITSPTAVVGASADNTNTTNSSTRNMFYFYQASDGGHVYMHPLDIKILKEEFKEYSFFPETIDIIAVSKVESTVDEDLRKRCKYLGHVPLNCDVSFIECDLEGIVSGETLKRFEKELSSRNRRIRKKAAENAQQPTQRRNRTTSFSSTTSGSVPLSPYLGDTSMSSPPHADHFLSEDAFPLPAPSNPISQNPQSDGYYKQSNNSHSMPSFARMAADAKKSSQPWKNNTSSSSREDTYFDEEDEYYNGAVSWEIDLEEVWERDLVIEGRRNGNGNANANVGGNGNGANSNGGGGKSKGKKKGSKGQVLLSNSARRGY